MRYLNVLAVGALCVSLIGCGSAKVASVQPVLMEDIAQNHVRRAILQAFDTRSWYVQSDDSGEFTAIKVSNDKKAQVLVSYTDTMVEISYLDSENMGYTVYPNYDKIHPAYNCWVKTLRDDIERELEYIVTVE